MKLLKENKFIQYFRNNKAIPICYGIAFVFWLLTKLSQTYTSDVVVHINYNVPIDQSLKETPPSNLYVNVDGNGWDLMLRYIRNPKPSINLSLADYSPSLINRRILKSKVESQMFARLRVNSVIPEMISFELDAKTTKKVAVNLNKDIKLSPQYQYSAPDIIFPDSVEIIGPEVVVKDIEEWSTDVIKRNKLNKTFTSKIEMKPHPNGEVNFSPKEIEYKIHVEQFTSDERRVSIEIFNAPENITDSIQIFPRYVLVKYEVGLSDFDRPSPDHFKLVADFNQIDTINKKIKLNLELTPDYLSNVRLSKNQVDYLIVKTDSLDLNQ